MEKGCSFLCRGGLSSGWSFIRGSTVSEIQYDFELGFFLYFFPPSPWIFRMCAQLLVCDSLVCCWDVGKKGVSSGILCVVCYSIGNLRAFWDWLTCFFDYRFGACDVIQVFSVSFIVLVSVTQLFITVMDTAHLSVCPVLLDCTCMQVFHVFFYCRSDIYKIVNCVPTVNQNVHLLCQAAAC